MEKGLEYTNDYFLQCLTTNEPIEIIPAETWSDDSWYMDQENREFIKNEGYVPIQEGEATGEIIGGNMSTLNLLQGTPYMPNLKGKILFLEEDSLTGKSTLKTFDRYLHSLMQQPDFEHITGIVIGRMQKEAECTIADIQEMISSKPELAHIPIIANANFGHTTPIFTFPIGGHAKIISNKKYIYHYFNALKKERTIRSFYDFSIFCNAFCGIDSFVISAHPFPCIPFA